jgi:hypothetical protein
LPSPRNATIAQTDGISRECCASPRATPRGVSFADYRKRSTGMAHKKPDKRSIVGGDGYEWLVREFENLAVGSISRSLVFERPEVVRRVRDYPRDWADLSDDQLYRLSLRT